MLEIDCEFPITLRLKVFIPEGLVLVKRNPQNLAGFTMLPQVVPISSSKIFCKGSSETISTVTVKVGMHLTFFILPKYKPPSVLCRSILIWLCLKVRNDGIHGVKINKGDEIGLVQIEKDLGQETPVSEVANKHMDKKNTHEEEEIKLIPKIQENKGKRSNSASTVREGGHKQNELKERPKPGPHQHIIVSRISSSQEPRSISDELLDHYKELHGEEGPSSSSSHDDERNMQFQRLRERFKRDCDRQNYNNWTSDELDN